MLLPVQGQALTANQANRRVTPSSGMMMQSGSSTIPVQNTSHNKRAIAAKRARRVPTDCPLRVLPPKNELPNPLVSSLSCSGPHGENQDIHPMNLQNQMGEEPHADANISLTEIARLCYDDSLDEEVDSSHGLVAVENYLVKPEVAPLLERIFTKYGDIAKDSDLHSPSSFTFYLELTCSVYQTLQRSTFRGITTDELLRMLSDIRDLENVKFNVGWLHRKVSELMEIKEVVMSYPALKEEKTKIYEEDEKLAALQQKLKARKDKYEEQNQKLQNIKYKIKDANEKELVDGLL